MNENNVIDKNIYELYIVVFKYFNKYAYGTFIFFICGFLLE